ncbi:MAG TPA: DivIVA domain-containing protein [Gaiellaceae bacterium]|nr:DivIVA domain-containing protein [Gaiellaceae bacterium]
MRYTPVELRHVRPTRGLFGYKRHEVDSLIEDVADSFEEVWRERGELVDKLEDVEKLLVDVKQREALLTSTLVSAERAAGDAREQARKEAELIVAEAHQEARSVTRAAQGERERLFGEVRRVETLLRAALGMVEETKHELPEAEGPSEHWPNRQDTREFQAVDPEAVAPQPQAFVSPKLPPVQPAPPAGADDGPWAGRDFAWG